MSDIAQPADKSDSDALGGSASPAESGESTTSAPTEAQPETSEVETAWRNATLAAHVGQMRGMDSVDTCRMRLVALRTRIETNWPPTGGLLFKRGQGLGPAASADIASLLVALPTPLPLQAGGEPEPIVRDTDTDMREVAGRAVDAGLALLEGTTLETIYRGHVKMLEDYRPDAPESIIVSNLTVGVLVATIIGTLDAISETVMETPRAGKEAASTPKAGNKSGSGKKAATLHAAPVKRGKSVPRI